MSSGNDFIQIEQDRETEKVEEMLLNCHERSKKVAKFLLRTRAIIYYNTLKENLSRFYPGLVENLQYKEYRSGEIVVSLEGISEDLAKAMEASEYGLPGFPLKPVFRRAERALKRYDRVRDKTVEKMQSDPNDKTWRSVE